MLTGTPPADAIISRGCNVTCVFLPKATPDTARCDCFASCDQNADNRAIFRLNAAMTNKRTGDLMVLCEAKFHEQAKENGWSPAHAEGYFAGASIRRRGEPLSRYALVGIDEYCMGLRAGYFVRRHRADFSVRSPEAFAAVQGGSAKRTAGEQA